MSIFRDKTLVTAAALITVASGAFSFYRYLLVRENDAKQATKTQVSPGGMLYSTNDLTLEVLPSALPTDPGFSQYARRWDVWQPPTLATGGLAYGQAIPTA